MRDKNEKEFSVQLLSASFSAEELAHYFELPTKLAESYHTLVVYLRYYDNLSALELTDIAGVSGYAYFPTKVEHHFFQQQNHSFTENKNFSAIFNNLPSCESYIDLFQLELNKTDYLKNKGAYFFITNTSVPEAEKDAAFSLFTEMLLPNETEENPFMKKLHKKVNSLGFEFIKDVSRDTLLKPKKDF